MTKNRAMRARKHAGLSLGQAAKLLNMPSTDLIAIEERDSDFSDADHERLADVYGVNVPWLKGEVELRDYASVDKIRGAAALTKHDRDVMAEFAASMTRKTPKTLAEVAEITKQAKAKKP